MTKLDATKPDEAEIKAFIEKWSLSGAAERANAQSFLVELCDIIGVERPDASTPDDRANAYIFEKSVPGPTGTTNFIDLYKRGCFVLETKQGADAIDDDAATPLSSEGEIRRRSLRTGHGRRGTKGWDTAMERARTQAENYARCLPPHEIPDGRPPFLLVVDVGHSIALYADWSRAGGHYAPFPDPVSYRVVLKDLLRPEIRQRLSNVWTDPLNLDPSRHSAKVTREIAARLARLARSLEGKHSPEQVSNFLMRCLFTMFSEDVGLLPADSYTTLLSNLKREPADFVPAMQNLWTSMNTGGYAAILQKSLPCFNGGLFASAEALSLDADQIQLLLEAAMADWRDVEPAIFGTLLERALDPRERHKLGAHYTPRAYVERLVQPTVMEPLREEWRAIQAAALHLAEDSKTDKAIAQVRAYLDRLAHVRVLDPACGSGNFLYVTLELLKRLEGEVLNTLKGLGATQERMELENVMVTPANMLGIEVNPRAAAIADLVLWIGFLQWHLRTRGNLSTVPVPILRDHHNIECRDAVLDWDSVEPLLDGEGQPVTRWDGRTTKNHPVTGEPVPDPYARTQVYRYHQPRPATWPKADYVVGNPPFIGSKRMREALSDGYVDALQEAWPEVPQATDFVMRWWHHAAELVRKGKIKRFGFITTNSLRQAYVRRAVEPHLQAKDPMHLAFAIPDHPWVDSSDGAAVRIAMTVGAKGEGPGQLATVASERSDAECGNDDLVISLIQRSGIINADLTAGIDVTSAKRLLCNLDLCSVGMKTIGAGFQIPLNQAQDLGLDRTEGLSIHVRPYINGRDFAQTRRGLYVIDFFGLSEAEVRRRFPEVYNYLLSSVKPERDQNRNSIFRRDWWIIGHPRAQFRDATNGLDRYVVTLETSKHRFFGFLPKVDAPDSSLVTFGFDDAYHLGVLSSRFHVAWALATGGRLGVGNDPRYNKTRCFETYPFPDATSEQQARIRDLAERLDAHRKRQQSLHPGLTMTGMYNVLERVRLLEHAETSDTAEPPLTAKEKQIYEEGLVGILKQLHDELDAAVADAYGWPADIDTDDILTRLVALNAERAAEEAKGIVRWLRPEYQNKAAAEGPSKTEQIALQVDDSAPGETVPVPSAIQSPWPGDLPAQAAALSAVLARLDAPASVETIAAHFEGRRTKKRLAEIERLLETLEALGRASRSDDGWSV